MNRKAKALEFADAGYNVQITGRHVEVTDAMKDYAMEKISKIERIMNRIIDVNVIMDIQKFEHHVEIILKAGNFKIISHATTTDMYASIDKAVDKLEAQVLKYKSKIQDHHAKGHAVMNMMANILSPQEIADDFTDEENELDGQEFARFKPHRVVSQENYAVKTLNYDEAVMEMELSDNAFIIFKNEIDQKLKVIHRHKDGNYGIIELSC